MILQTDYVADKDVILILELNESYPHQTRIVIKQYGEIRLYSESRTRHKTEQDYSKLLLSLNRNIPPPNCPKCNSVMKLRMGTKGLFWGCTKFSSGCKGSRNFEIKDREKINNLFSEIE